MSRTLRLAVLVSGSGSNLEAILDAAEQKGLPGVQVALVISSRPDALALERAKKHGVPSAVIDPRQFPNDSLFQKELLIQLTGARVDVVCLAGYLRKIGASLLERFRGRILNIHPALLPKYGGMGMYGHRVHEAVLQAGEKESGCTVHLVDEEFDHGPILAQTRVPVLSGDTPERLAERILEQEHQLYPKAIQQFCARVMASAAKGEGR